MELTLTVAALFSSDTANLFQKFIQERSSKNVNLQIEEI